MEDVPNKLSREKMDEVRVTGLDAADGVSLILSFRPGVRFQSEYTFSTGNGKCRQKCQAVGRLPILLWVLLLFLLVLLNTK